MGVGGGLGEGTLPDAVCRVPAIFFFLVCPVSAAGAVRFLFFGSFLSSVRRILGTCLAHTLWPMTCRWGGPFTLAHRAGLSPASDAPIRQARPWPVGRPRHLAVAPPGGQGGRPPARRRRPCPRPQPRLPVPFSGRAWRGSTERSPAPSAPRLGAAPVRLGVGGQLRVCPAGGFVRRCRGRGRGPARGGGAARSLPAVVRLARTLLCWISRPPPGAPPCTRAATPVWSGCGARTRAWRAARHPPVRAAAPAATPRRRRDSAFLFLS